jgi:hypothetical protein
MMRKFRYVFYSSLLLILAGCAAQPEQAEIVEIPFDPAAMGKPTHMIDAVNSSAVIRVYSAGAMSKLGHNHIVLARDIRGEVWATESGTAFHLVLPVASFSVDPAELRAEAGPDFSSQPSVEDVHGTRRNMLGEKVLNAAQHPVIELWSERTHGSGERLTAEAVVAARGQLSRILIPVTLATAAGVTTASGEFTLKQSAIGMTPFSILMGAIAVRDELEIRYSLTAVIND